MFSTRNHFWVVVFLTIIISIIVYCFTINGHEEVIDHPQFGYFSNYEEILKIIKADVINGYRWYNLFFLFDLIWAPLLLLLLCRIIIRNDKLTYPNWSIQAWLMCIFSILAYASDVTENLHYLFCDTIDCGKDLEVIVKVKIACYGIAFFIFLIHLYQKYVVPRNADIKRCIKATRFSLIIILLLIILSTLLPQGSTVIIHLLHSPVNCMASILLMNILAYACAHYPDYIGTKDDKDKEWIMETVFMKKKLGIGFIYYIFEKLPDKIADEVSKKSSVLGLSRTSSLAPQRQATDVMSPSQEKCEKPKNIDSKFFEHFRKAIGGLFFLAWMYTLLFLIQKYIYPAFPVLLFMIMYALVFGFIYILCYNVKKDWQKFYHEKEEKEEFTKAALITSMKERRLALSELMPVRFKRFLHATIIAFFLILVFTLFTGYLANHNDWEWTGLFLLISACTSLFFFILFQNFRKVFSFYIPPWPLRWTGIHLLNIDLVYIITFAVAGYASFVTVIAGLWYESNINSLNWILLYFYLYYGFFILLLKHNIYYTHVYIAYNRWVKLLYKFFISYVPILPFLLLVWMIFTAQTGNGLHKLDPVKEASHLDIKQYMGKLEANFIPGSSDTSLYYVASYGGGLRATAWTMLLLNSITKRDTTFLMHTAAMSGVSGGFVGLALFNAIQFEYQDTFTRSAKIDSIGWHNILSIEVANLLGPDFFRELIPYVECLGNDRDAQTMNKYATLITPNKSIQEKSFREYWYNGYLSSNQHFMPALIGNTTGTHGRHGVAFSVHMDSLLFDTIFLGADDILEHPDQKSLLYLDATSTTERFPVFSPTAQIKGKGHYLDGGYFENSGLLSILNFQEYIDKEYPTLNSLTGPMFILIINSKDAYIREVIKEKWGSDQKISMGETNAILETITNIDILPYALEQRVQFKFGDRFKPIYLPYAFTFEEAVGVMRGVPSNPLEIEDIINKSNHVVDSVWLAHRDTISPVMVEPSLARVLSDPAYAYMVAMLQHPEVKVQLDTIVMY